MYQIFNENCVLFCKIKQLAGLLVKKWLVEGRKYSDDYLLPIAVRFAESILSDKRPLFDSEKNMASLAIYQKQFEKWLGCHVLMGKNKELYKNSENRIFNYVYLDQPSEYLQKIIQKIENK